MSLDLMVAVTDHRELQLGLAVRVDTGIADLDASATVLSVPLDGGPTQVVPSAAVLLVASGEAGSLVDNGTAVHVDELHAGFRLSGGHVQPWLALTGVVLDTVDHGTIDLTDADAVTGVITAQVEQLLTDAFGNSAQAHALLALLGLEDPVGHPGAPRAAPLDLLRSPLPTLAALHRGMLADHSWSAMLESISTLLGLPGEVSGAGTDVRPWLVPVATAGPVTLSLAAWNAGDATTQRLRLGLHATATVGPFTTTLRSELLAIDLPETGAGGVALVAEQRVVLAFAPGAPVTTSLGLTVGVDAVTGTARWRPGDPLTWEVEVAGLFARTGAESYGPFTWTWPDGAGPDLGPVGLGVVRLLIANALHAWGGDAAYVLGALLGLHRQLPSLPADWPVLTGDLESVLADPAAALRDLAQRLLSGVSATGEPYAPQALRIAGALLRSWEAPAGVRPEVDVTVTGGGTYDDPWAVPLPATDGESADLLVWLDPEGPPADWLASNTDALAAVSDGAGLAGLLARVAPFDERLRQQLTGRNGLGAGLDALAAWLRDSDGLVPLAAQLPTGWTPGSTVSAPHTLLPHDPSVIAQVRAQVTAWAAPALYVAPQFADHQIWAELAPGAPHLDLRALPDPRDVDLGTVTDVATQYTTDLLAGVAQSETDQLARAVQRVAAITPAAKITLVAHSTAGVPARLLAATHPELIAGVITIGTPHAASPLTALTDDATAAALRVAAGLGGPIATSAVGAAISELAADLAGGALDDAARQAFTAGPAALAGVVDTVPRLAIGSALGGDPIGLLVGALAASPTASRKLPTHVGFGARFALDVSAGDIKLDAHARVDLARLRLVPGASEPARASTAASVSLTATCPGGWLVGTEAAGTRARVRWLEAGLTVRPGAPGAVAADPWLRLHDASAEGPVSLADVRAALDAVAALTTTTDAAARERADEAATAAREALRAALDAVLTELAAAAAGSPARVLLELARAAGLVFDTADGVRSSAAGILALAQTPVATLAARRDELLAALAQLIGGGPLTIALGSLPLELALDVPAGTLRLRTTADLELAAPLRLRLDTTLATSSMRISGTAALSAGPVALSAGADGSVVLTAAPWLDPLTLRPFDPGRLEQALLALVPRVSVSAAISLLLGSRVGGAIGPVDALLRDPVGWLRRADAFGTAAGALDGTKINDLLRTLAGAVGLDAADGMLLPGGYLISAAGTNPCRIGLAGTFGDPDTAMLHVDVAIDAHPDRSVTPAATVLAAIALPGQWGTVTVTFTLDSTGVGLLVTPARNAQPIRLLPTVDGLGLLVGGATALLPTLLQDAVNWLQDQAGAHDVLDIVLDIAAGLGIYDAAAQSFTAPAQVAALRRMLQPGWLQDEIADSGALADLIVSLFGPGKITLPAGHRIDRVADRVRWQMPVFAGCTVSAELGWGTGGTPQVMVGVSGLDTGPVVITDAQLGWLDGLTGLLRLTVDPGGDFAFFVPELEVDAGPGLVVRVLPLGAAADADCKVEIVPDPHVQLTTDGGLQLVTAWLVPLISRFVLPLVDDLLDTVFWAGGPTARDVLEGGGLIVAGGGPAQLVSPLPDLPHLGLGALGALVQGHPVHLTDTLDLAAAMDSGRLGLRVSGTVPIEGSDVDVTVLLGHTGWTHEPGDGITLWILRQDAAALPPFALEPALRIGGIGVDVHGHGTDHPLVDGAFKLGGAAAVVFADIDFLNAARALALTVSNVGGAIAIDDAQIEVSGSDGDSIVAKVVPNELRAPFGLAVGYRNGAVEFYETVGSHANGIELTFPLDLDLFGVIFLRELFLSLLAEDGMTGIAALSANASLGPLAVAVDRVGLRVHVHGGTVQFGFKPPDAFGVSMDVSVVKVGGFLLVDEQHGRYVGAIEIAILQKFSLTAIGIITTKKPDGSPGFSLLLLITVQLPVPIPMGYGFFFAGAGGLLGLNRGMDVDRIRIGLRAGTADSILFPTDIVRRIDVIVRDLEESFPQAEGHFLIGPMAFIQWMNPALVTAKVGVVIEIAPQPNIAILGVLRIALPTPDEAVVDLKVAFLGSIDVAAGLLAFDASIYDSKIGYGDYSLSLEGDIAIRICWGRTPDLVASIGGFHPNYTPNANLKLPAMRRITLSLLKDNPRITLRLYFAVTSNTVQVGAQLELYVGVSGFSVSGDMGFDVLVQVVPFLIDAHMWAHLAVKAGGTDICSISLDLSLRGPAPWIAHGSASISILFFSVSVEVEARFGEDLATSLPGVAVLDRLLDQLRDAANWAAELTELPAVALYPVTGLVVDAGGLLTVRQNLLPLATDIALVGASPPADINRAEITAFAVGADPQFEDVTAPYAPSTFAGAPSADADRLRAPAFEERPTGARSRGGSSLVSSLAVGYQAAYERIILDDPDPTSQKVTPPVEFGLAWPAARSGSAQVRRSAATPPSAARCARWAPPNPSTPSPRSTTSPHSAASLSYPVQRPRAELRRSAATCRSCRRCSLSRDHDRHRR